MGHGLAAQYIVAPILRHGPQRSIRAWWLIAVASVALIQAIPVAQADAPQGTVSLAPSLPSSQPVGATIGWIASATGLNNPVYRFSVAPANGSYSVWRDFSPANTFAWTPLQEGSYTVKVSVEDGYSSAGAASIEAALSFTIASRISGATAVVSPTSNPLVALYSAPPCSTGRTVVMFRPTSDPFWTSTSALPCQAGKSLNFLVAGMQANTTYVLQHVVTGAGTTTTSAPQSFTTGALPSALSFPSFTVPIAGKRQDSDVQSSTIFYALPTTAAGIANPLATDLNGDVVWYYDTLQSGLAAVWPTQLVPGGAVLLLGHDAYHSIGYDVLREVDLAGDLLRETDVDAVNAQLAARGQEAIYGFHHDALRLPDGDTAVLGQTQQTIDGEDIMGDMLIVLDANFQVVWTWDAFNNLDPHRRPVLGETCATGDPGFCTVPDPQAADWLHTNKIGWSPADGDLTLSLRNQDWVIKIDYQNGAGDGHVIWRLGQGGDFSIASTDPAPWFSHQHDAHYIDATTMTVFDNGNTRCQTSQVTCDSRGQVLALDEQQHVATPLLNADLGSYSPALGSAERLPNGNYVFTSGLQALGAVGQSIEVQPDGTQVYVQQANTALYRAYRLDDLYSGTDPLTAPCSVPLVCATSTDTSTPIAPTAIVPTSATAAPPPTTPVAAPTNTPVPPPTNTPVTPPTNTPVTPPTNTPVTPPTTTPLPSATQAPRHNVVPTPSSSATMNHKPPSGVTPLHLAITVPQRTFLGDGSIVVQVRTHPRTAMTVIVQLQEQRHIARMERGKRITRDIDVVVYHDKVRATADAKGQATVRLHLAYNPMKAVQAQFKVIAQVSHVTATRSVRVTVQPAWRRTAALHPTSSQPHSARPQSTMRRWHVR